MASKNKCPLNFSEKKFTTGGGIERWEDEHFRSCFADILDGNWRKHDPYALEGRLNAKTSLYGRIGQSSIFRTFQGWLALRCDVSVLLNVFLDINPLRSALG